MAIFVTGKVTRTVVDPDGGSDTFDGVREVRGRVRGAPPRGPRSGRALLQATHIGCRATTSITRADHCLSCKRFVNFVPSPDRTEVTIRCAWNGDGPATDLMVPLERLVTVPGGARSEEALRLAGDYEQDFLLVVDGGVLLGVVRRNLLEWAAPERPVTTLIQRRVWVATSAATLADVSRMLLDAPVDVVIVADDGTLRGLITRADLRDVGCL